MKLFKHHLFIALLFLFIGLKANETYGQVERPKKEVAQKKKGKTLVNGFIVSGKVTQTYSYCGGAAPPAEMLEKLAKPVAYPDKKFYIRKGKVNSENSPVITSFTTNKDGIFSLQLQPGVYSIILEEQLHKIKPGEYTKPGLEVDEQCLEIWWVKPFYLIVVKNKPVNNLIFRFHHRCFIENDLPCITYVGPSPS